MERLAHSKIGRERRVPVREGDGTRQRCENSQDASYAARTSSKSVPHDALQMSLSDSKEAQGHVRRRPILWWTGEMIS